MAELHRVLYASTATGKAHTLLEVAIILGQSQRNNAQRDLTGALAAHRGRFVQVIEGPRDAVDHLLRRLHHDPRHEDIRLLDRAVVEARRFGRWSMASALVTPEAEPCLDRIVDGLAVDPRGVIEALHAAAA